MAPGNPANVTIDTKGYLHLRIVHHKRKWTASEVFTTDDFSFGTYQWVVEGNVYDIDTTTVLGLFPYGPTHHFGGDAENEIDIEFSQWNKTCHGCNADFTVYPSTGMIKLQLRPGKQFPRYWWNGHHGENAVVLRPYRLYANGWCSTGGNDCQCDQDRNLLVRRNQHSAGRDSRRHQFLVFQADSREGSVRDHSRLFSLCRSERSARQMGTSGCSYGLIQPTVVSCAPHLRQVFMSRIFQSKTARPPQQPHLPRRPLLPQGSSNFDFGESPEEGSERLGLRDHKRRRAGRRSFRF